MLFNSLDFLIFLPLVFLLYWGPLARNLRLQNLFLIGASYVFYGWWDWRFLSLIVLSTGVDFLAGQQIGKAPADGRRRKSWLLLSIGVNLGVLGFFKYFNFFVDSFAAAFTLFGRSLDSPTLQLILPVGISFYTFQTLSYTIDVYRGKLEPTRDPVAFAAFVAFFPQLVAGPIERAARLLPQMQQSRHFDAGMAISGLRLMLWGFFKKIVIADGLAPLVNQVFATAPEQGSGVLLLGAVLFSFQIYGDFSGYTDIARGVARLLGFELMLNFNFPYFSRSIAEFWRRWHISLSSWFKDYLYIPLGGSREGRLKGIRNVFIIFAVSGLWHGANWTFVAWGLYHALLFVPSFLLGTNRQHRHALVAGRWGLPPPGTLLRIALTFLLVSLGWILFRSESLPLALDYLQGIFQFRASSLPLLNPYDHQPMTREWIVLGAFVIVEYLLATGQLKALARRPLLQLLGDAALLVLLVLHIPLSEQLSFIYFQF